MGQQASKPVALFCCEGMQRRKEKGGRYDERLHRWSNEG